MPSAGSAGASGTHRPDLGAGPPDPADAIRAVIDFADTCGAVKIFDAGDVRADGFRPLHDQRPGQTYSDTGSSYMGFAVSALLASALVKRPSTP